MILLKSVGEESKLFFRFHTSDNFVKWWKVNFKFVYWDQK